MWNKYPYTAIHLWRCARSLVCILVVWMWSGCISNPTPHPAVDGGFLAAGGIDAVSPAGPPAGGGSAESDGAHRGQDAHDLDSAEMEGDGNEEDAGPEDGGGSTEPMG